MKETDKILELDLLKSFIIIFPMIGIHTMYDLTILDYKYSILEYILNITASQFGAPIFMFCMGVTFNFSRKQRPIDYLHRGIILITTGMVLNILRYLPTAYSATITGDDNIFRGWALIFNVDILQFAGLAFMLFALLRKLNMSHWVIFAIGLLLSIVGTLLDGFYTDSYVVNQLLGYFYPTPTCSCFSLMNWFIFVAAGNLTGLIYRNYNIEKFLRIAFPVGIVITVVYLYLCLVIEVPFTRCLQNDWGLYSMHTPDALFTTLGIAPFMLGTFRLLSKVFPERWKNFLCYPSRHINQYYCVSWVWIMWTANLFLFIPKDSTKSSFLFTWFMIVLLTTITVIIYNKYLKADLNNFFSIHLKFWITGIWVALILFGIWYFSTVPEPYTMPY